MSSSHVSVCVLFLPDKASALLLDDLTQTIKNKYPKIFVPKKIRPGNLPYHMTILGGIRLPLSSYRATVLSITRELLPFNQEPVLPALIDVEDAILNGNTVALRLKFKTGTYKLTGVRARNKELLRELGIEHFRLNDVRHITLGNVPGGYQDLDTVTPFFIKEVEEHKSSLLRMTLAPQIWVKKDGFWRMCIA